MTEACAPAIRYRLAQLNPCRLRERDTREPRGPGLRVCVSRGLRGGYRLLHDALAMMSKVRTNLLHEPWLSGLRGPYAGVGRRALCRTCRRQGLFCREPLDLYTGHGLPCVGVCGACTRLTLPVIWFVRARPARAKLCLHTCGRMHRLCPAYVLCRAREACAGRDLPLLIFVHAH